MRFSSPALLAVFTAAGCNQVLGLEPTADDHDADGIADSRDNCPFDFNPQQRDRDGNGLGDVCDCAISGVDGDHDDVDDACDDCIGPGAVGTDVGGDGIDDGCELCASAIGQDMDGDGTDDACDPCDRGDDHDEDGDTIADACDNCPTIANADQTETDLDALGDACDRDGLKPPAMQFDGFGARDPLIWTGTVPGWEWKDDGLNAVGMAQRVAAMRVSGPFLAETLSPFPQAAQVIRLSVGGGGNSALCQLDGNGELTMTHVVGFTAQVVHSGPVPMTATVRLRVLFDGTTMSCLVVDAAGDVTWQVGGPASVGSGRIGLAVDMGGRFEYVWLVGAEP